MKIENDLAVTFPPKYDMGQKMKAYIVVFCVPLVLEGGGGGRGEGRVLLICILLGGNQFSTGLYCRLVQRCHFSYIFKISYFSVI